MFSIWQTQHMFSAAGEWSLTCCQARLLCSQIMKSEEFPAPVSMVLSPEVFSFVSRTLLWPISPLRVFLIIAVWRWIKHQTSSFALTVWGFGALFCWRDRFYKWLINEVIRLLCWYTDVCTLCILSKRVALNVLNSFKKKQSVHIHLCQKCSFSDIINKVFSAFRWYSARHSMQTQFRFHGIRCYGDGLSPLMNPQKFKQIFLWSCFVEKKEIRPSNRRCSFFGHFPRSSHWFRNDFVFCVLQVNIVISGWVICGLAGLDFHSQCIYPTAFITTCLHWGQGLKKYLCGKLSYVSVSSNLLQYNFRHV